MLIEWRRLCNTINSEVKNALCCAPFYCNKLTIHGPSSSSRLCLPVDSHFAFHPTKCTFFLYTVALYAISEFCCYTTTSTTAKRSIILNLPYTHAIYTYNPYQIPPSPNFCAFWQLKGIQYIYIYIHTLGKKF